MDIVPLLNVTLTLLNVTPRLLNITLALLNITLTLLNVTLTLLNVTPTLLNVMLTLLNVAVTLHSISQCTVLSRFLVPIPIQSLHSITWHVMWIRHFTRIQCVRVQLTVLRRELTQFEFRIRNDEP